jgi:hypothetical protein
MIIRCATVDADGVEAKKIFRAGVRFVAGGRAESSACIGRDAAFPFVAGAGVRAGAVCDGRVEAPVDFADVCR